jgi:hypothetical protein
LNVSATQSPSFSYGVKERIFAHFTIASYSSHFTKKIVDRFARNQIPHAAFGISG